MTVALFPLGEGGRGIGFLFAKLPKNINPPALPLICGTGSFQRGACFVLDYMKFTHILYRTHVNLNLRILLKITLKQAIYRQIAFACIVVEC